MTSRAGLAEVIGRAASAHNRPSINIGQPESALPPFRKCWSAMANQLAVLP
jgi:hypothetical protein